MKDLFNRHKKLIFLLGFLSVLFFLTYPKGYLSIDEHDYIENSKLIWSNGLKQECVEDNISQIDLGEYCIYKYNIGSSIILLPINIFGEGFTYTIAFIFFVLSIIIFYKILGYWDLNSDLIFLFALFPAIAYYSRTAYSEIYSIFFSLLFYYSYIRSTRNFNILAGISMGISTIVRPTNLFFYLSFIFFDKIGSRNKLKWINKKDIVAILLGLTPFLLFFFLFNTYLYQSPFNTGYTFSKDMDSFNISLIPMNLSYYLILLNLFYPGMFFISILSKHKHKWPLILSFMLLLVFYSATSSNNFKSDINIIIGIRFLIPFLPFIILLFIDVLKKYLKGIIIKVILLIMLVIIIAMNYIHYDYLNNNVDIWLQNHKEGLIDDELSWY